MDRINSSSAGTVSKFLTPLGDLVSRSQDNVDVHWLVLKFTRCQCFVYSYAHPVYLIDSIVNWSLNRLPSLELHSSMIFFFPCFLNLVLNTKPSLNMAYSSIFFNLAPAYLWLFTYLSTQYNWLKIYKFSTSLTHRTSTHPFTHSYIYPTIRPPIHVSTHPSIHSSIYQPIRSPTSIHPLIYPSILQSNNTKCTNAILFNLERCWIFFLGSYPFHMWSTN